MILFINACVRELSRTKKLADCLLSKMGDRIEEVRLSEIEFPTANESFLQKRDRLIAAGDFSDALFSFARQFANADQIVIAAPYWDLSFPASVKQYFEQINVTGITFKYTPEGYPIGLCKAKKLYYIMTAGGMYVPEEFGFGYVESLARNFYGIEDIELIKAVGLDIDGMNAEEIMRESIAAIKA